jgi:diguanylate cyclase (GGDEF)-like protein
VEALIKRRLEVAASGKKKSNYRKMVQTVPDVMYEVDENGKFVFLSEAVRIFGYSPEELLGKNFTSVIHPDDVKKVSRESILPKFKGKATGDIRSPKLFNERRTKKRMTKNMEARILPGPGKKNKREVFFVEVHSSGLWTRDGEKTGRKFEGTLGIFRDITHRKFFELDLAKKYKDLTRVIEKNPDGMVVLNRKNEFLFVNRAAEKLYNRKSGDFAGKLFDVPINSGSNMEIQVTDPSGDRMVLEAIATDIDWEGEKGYLVSLRDVTESYNVREMFCEVSMRDEGTDLYNRRAFMVLANQQLKLSKRAKENVYLLFADMDNLKKVNDEYGHDEGDRALLEIADSLRAVFRESDIIARISGDEFVVMGVVTQKKGVNTAKTRLRAHLAFLDGVRGSPYTISLSIGDVCVVPGENTSVAEMLKKADKKMYEEKQKKKR